MCVSIIYFRHLIFSFNFLWQIYRCWAIPFHFLTSFPPRYFPILKKFSLKFSLYLVNLTTEPKTQKKKRRITPIIIPSFPSTTCLVGFMHELAITSHISNVPITVVFVRVARFRLLPPVLFCTRLVRTYPSPARLPPRFCLSFAFAITLQNASPCSLPLHTFCLSAHSPVSSISAWAYYLLIFHKSLLRTNEGLLKAIRVIE